jgi:hypothetical protein
VQSGNHLQKQLENGSSRMTQENKISTSKFVDIMSYQILDIPSYKSQHRQALKGCVCARGEGGGSTSPQHCQQAMKLEKWLDI